MYTYAYIHKKGYLKFSPQISLIKPFFWPSDKSANIFVGVDILYPLPLIIFQTIFELFYSLVKSPSFHDRINNRSIFPHSYGEYMSVQ